MKVGLVCFLPPQLSGHLSLRQSAYPVEFHATQMHSVFVGSQPGGENSPMLRGWSHLVDAWVRGESVLANLNLVVAAPFLVQSSLQVT